MKSFDHLIGLPYKWGENDCYSAVRRFYNEVFDMQLRDYVRPKDFWQDNIDLYGDNFRSEGFRTIDLPHHELMPGDGFLIAIGASFPTHAAVYVGGDDIFHHFTGQLSSREPYKGIWRARTVATLRHPEVAAKLVVQPKKLELADMMPAHLKEKFRDFRNQSEANALPVDAGGEVRVPDEVGPGPGTEERPS